MMMNRRILVWSLAASSVVLSRNAFAALPVFYRSPGCGCCHIWTERMAQAGLPVGLQDSSDLSALSAGHGIPQGLEGCHVGEIDGYVISGHVPPANIKRLLSERPKARGLLVPGMPVGSPGMEMNGKTEPYDVLLLGNDGATTVFASYA
jgi:hypothetical protein